MKRLLLSAAVMLSWLFASAQCPPAAPLTTPLIDDLSSLSPGQSGSTFSNCWVATTTSIPRWEAEDAQGSNENSLDTGPWYDNTNFGQPGGMYVYLETSGGSLGDTCGFMSPPIDLSTLTAPELDFSYHMYGAAMGELEVQINAGSQWDSVFAINGQQQLAGSDVWNRVIVPLSAYANQTVAYQVPGDPWFELHQRHGY